MPPADPPVAPIGSVLFVCTGNVCRSPYAEARLRHLLPDLPVASAGIGALEGAGMDAPMAAELTGRGGSAAGFRSRQVSADDLSADLVLTMNRRQREWLLEEDPTLARRVGLLGAVPRLRSPAGRPLTRADVASWTRLAVHGEDEISDPYRQPPPAATRAADRLDACVAALADLLAPGHHTDRPSRGIR